MIDITPFQQRLQYLNDWIRARIDGVISPPIWVNIDAIDFNLTMDDIMRIWQQAGMLYFTKSEVVGHPAIPVSFDEYCKYRTELKQDYNQ